MPRIITSTKRNLIARLLAGGMGYREIVRRTHVSRGTVSTIAAERREEVPEPMRSAVSEWLQPIVTVPKYKCVGCGFDVVVRPCLVCKARAAKRRR